MEAGVVMVLAMPVVEVREVAAVGRAEEEEATVEAVEEVVVVAAP